MSSLPEKREPVIEWQREGDGGGGVRVVGDCGVNRLGEEQVRVENLKEKKK